MKAIALILIAFAALAGAAEPSREILRDGAGRVLQVIERKGFTVTSKDAAGRTLYTATSRKVGAGAPVTIYRDAAGRCVATSNGRVEAVVPAPSRGKEKRK